jgi:uncharacterized SAM-dependent methyltransferase
MASPEYYLTNCEMEIFEQQGKLIAEAIAAPGPFELVELGSGDGLKTRTQTERPLPTKINVFDHYYADQE